MNKIMNVAKNMAMDTILSGKGGPFGAVIVDESGKIVGKGANEVIARKDPTAHAEVVAIRDACFNLGTYDLSGCVLYTSCEPCPMCLSALIWANIKKVYYGCNKKDAGSIGFRDDYIYDYIKGKKNIGLSMKCIDRDECLEVFDKYKDNNGIIY